MFLPFHIFVAAYWEGWFQKETVNFLPERACVTKEEKVVGNSVSEGTVICVGWALFQTTQTIFYML